MKKQFVAVSYIRFSTPEQAKGDSFRRQTAASKTWCQRNDWKLDTSYKLNDLGLSGFRGRNAKTGKLKAFLDGLESGKIKTDGLIIESLDRLSRNEVSDALRLFLNILSHGVSIITTNPENVFDQASINDPANLIMAILEMCRGYGESKLKSERVAEAWAEKKLNARTGHKVSARCPGWLKLNPNRDAFDFVPAKVASIKRLITLAQSGLGLSSIARILNQERLPTLRDHAKHWHSSSVYKVLTSRALIGEYQPRFSNKYQTEKHRQADGDPIADYYPSLLSEVEFLAIQSGLQTRREINQTQSGRSSTRVTNLFSKTIRCARTGATVVRIDKGKKSIPALVSDRRRAGLATGAEKLTFPYEDFEYHFLSWLSEVDVSDLSNESQISDAKKRLLVVKDLISKTSDKLKSLKARLAEEDEFDSLVDVIKDLDRKLKLLKEEQGVLQLETAKQNPIGEAGTLIRALEVAEGSEEIELRSKLRFMIAELIESIHVRFEKFPSGRRVAFTQVHFRNGLVRKMSVTSEVVYVGGGKTNPKPERRSWSKSTPQIDAICDLRRDEDFVGWLAGLNMGGEFLTMP